jgi:hypothetical protein
MASASFRRTDIYHDPTINCRRHSVRSWLMPVRSVRVVACRMKATGLRFPIRHISDAPTAFAL